MKKVHLIANPGAQIPIPQCDSLSASGGFAMFRQDWLGTTEIDKATCKTCIAKIDGPNHETEAE
jgi:hypothetical protein